MSGMILLAIKAVDENSYVTTFGVSDGAEKEFRFTVTEDLGIPSVEWEASFEQALDMRLSLARPLIEALQAFHLVHKEPLNAS